MRNLQVLRSAIVSSPSLAGCQHIAIDYDTKLVYCISGSYIVGLDVQLRKVGLPTTAATASGSSFDDEYVNNIVIHLQHEFNSGNGPV